jgi:hydroxymethylglutaryl-CoA lyase
MSQITLVECPRDAFQGLPRIIPVERKVEHLQKIVAAGVAEIDFGSFVSPKAVPQMADTEDVLRAFRQAEPDAVCKLIAIIANERGLDRALEVGGVTAVGYPLSVSETFQRNNTRASITESWPVIEAIHDRAAAAHIETHVYLSMAFGNPYGDDWTPDLVAEFADRLADLGVTAILLADTVGRATPTIIRATVEAVRSRIGEFGLGAHLHAAPHRWRDNVTAAWDCGCTRIDTSLAGIGGCPFAQDDLVGNVPTEGVASLFDELGITHGLHADGIAAAAESARTIFEEFGHE